MTLAETDTELRAWLDRLAIQDLINRYSDAVTRADWDQCRSVFVPDALWEVPAMGLRFESADAFVDMLDSPGTQLLIQTPHSSVIRLRIAISRFAACWNQLVGSFALRWKSRAVVDGMRPDGRAGRPKADSVGCAAAP